MTLNRRQFAVAACTFVALPAAPALAQENYPNKPIRIIVPLPPGGSNDVLARILGAKMTETFGQPVIVENRPGAAGNIATDFLAKSAPDGYTLGIAPNQTVAVNPVLYPKLPFNPHERIKISIVLQTNVVAEPGPPLAVEND